MEDQKSICKHVQMKQTSGPKPSFHKLNNHNSSVYLSQFPSVGFDRQGRKSVSFFFINLHTNALVYNVE